MRRIWLRVAAVPALVLAAAVSSAEAPGPARWSFDDDKPGGPPRGFAFGRSGGSGWAILDLNYATGDLRIYGTSDHSQSVAFGQPLRVLDMFEHAYAMDFGAAHAKYIDAFFQNVAWAEVDRRLDRGERALQVLRG
jgi:Fe-Mn family superoxide dismutase